MRLFRPPGSLRHGGIVAYEPLKFSALPLYCGSPGGMKMAAIPKYSQSPMTRDKERAPVPQAAIARVVELDLTWPAERLPALAEEGEGFVHVPGLGQAQADGAIEGILADPDVVALPLALEVERPYQIDLVEFIRLLRLGCRIGLAGQ
jgi:hypothetical protein